MRVELNIEELILHGFDPRDRDRIGQAIEREMMRLFSVQGIPQSLKLSYTAENIDGGLFEMAPGLGAEAIGRNVAQSVYGGMIK
jgi:hypothetical protein